MKQKTEILKRSLLLGIVWALGSLQYIQTLSAVFLLSLVLGIVECVCSINYRSKPAWVLRVLLLIQGIYYLACIAYVFTMHAGALEKTIVIILAACMVLFIGSVWVTLKNTKASASESHE